MKKQVLRACFFIKMQLMIAHILIDKLTDKYRIGTRAKMHSESGVSNWASWFIIPVDNYVEASSYGPYPVEEIEWIEINPVVEIPVGRLVKPLIRSYLNEIRNQLEAEQIRFEIHKQVLRVFLN